MRSKRQIAAIALTLIGSVAILEAGLRYIDRYPMGGFVGYYADTPVGAPLAAVPNCAVFSPTPEPHMVYTNRHGHRCLPSETETTTTAPYVAILGASDVFGVGVDYQDSFAYIASEHLAAHGLDFENIAVPANTFQDEVVLFQRWIEKVEPAPKAIVFTVNHMIIATSHIPRDRSQVIWGNLYPAERWHWPFAKTMLRKTSATFCFFWDGVAAARRQLEPAPVGPDFSSRGISVIGEAFSRKHRIHSEAGRQEVIERFKTLDGLARARGVRPVYLYLPVPTECAASSLISSGELDPKVYDTQVYSSLLETYCRENDAGFINLLPTLQHEYETGRPLALKNDRTHINAATSKIVGAFLGEAIVAELNGGQP